MNLNDQKKEPLRTLELSSKKQMLVMQYKGTQQDGRSKTDKPYQYIETLKQIKDREMGSPVKILNSMESLRVALTNNPLKWVSEFGANAGMQAVFKVLDMATNKLVFKKYSDIVYFAFYPSANSIRTRKGSKPNVLGVS